MLERYAQRRNALRKKLRDHHLDALLVLYDANRFYLSGFELHDCQANESSGCLIIAEDGNDWLLTDARYTEACARIWPRERIVCYRRNVSEVLVQYLRHSGVRIGVEMQTMGAALWRKLNAASQLAFLPADDLIREMRMIKDSSEIEALDHSFALNHAMLDWLEGWLAPGYTEKEISWKIEQYFREHGAEELAFPSIVAVDANAALPHAVPSEARIQENALVLVDVGARVDQYCSDQTRTFWVGTKPSQRFLETRALVREAQQAAIEMMRPGIALKECYHAARNVFVHAHVEEYFTHGLGHGVGLETHEAPSLSPSNAGLLQEGMVVTVEPGLYYPEWGGVRWEYTVVVEKDGVRIL